jgi:hypothetical protein
MSEVPLYEAGREQEQISARGSSHVSPRLLMVENRSPQSTTVTKNVFKVVL